MLLLHDRPQQRAGGDKDPDALIREARRLRRRRWLRRLSVLVTAGAVGGLVVAEIASSPSQGVGTRGGRSRSLTAKGGAFVTPNTPASLAVGSNGGLYVIDSGRDQILRRLPDGNFQVVAGNGRQGFSGDGGAAVSAKLRLEYYSGLAIANNGTVYFSDSGNKRVRAVLPDGRIETVAGGGNKPMGRKPINAHAALLASGRGSSDEVAGLAIDPNHELYIGLQTGVYRLTPNHTLVHVIGSQVSPRKLTPWDRNPGNAEDFLGATRLAFDRAGDLFVVGGGGGWGLYERTTTGALRFVHILRGVADGDGSGDGAIASNPAGQVITASNFGIETTNTAGRLRPFTADASKIQANLSRIIERASKDRLAEFRPGGGIAVAANGTIYLDANAGMFSTVGGILAVGRNGQITTLWLSRITRS